MEQYVWDDGQGECGRIGIGRPCVKMYLQGVCRDISKALAKDMAKQVFDEYDKGKRVMSECNTCGSKNGHKIFCPVLMDELNEPLGKCSSNDPDQDYGNLCIIGCGYGGVIFEDDKLKDGQMKFKYCPKCGHEIKGDKE